jgi:hypothetical protein
MNLVETGENTLEQIGEQENHQDIPFDEWKRGIYMYETFIEPLEAWVAENRDHRQYANMNIHECKTFPNKEFNIDNYKSELVHAKEDKEEGSMLFFEINGDKDNMLVMGYNYKTKDIVYTYKCITFRHGNKLEETMPVGWDKLKGSEHIIGKYNDYDNWVFYSRLKPLERDNSKYQIIGWNRESFSLFFTC